MLGQEIYKILNKEVASCDIKISVFACVCMRDFEIHDVIFRLYHDHAERHKPI